MPDILEEALRDALRTVKYPGFSRDIVSFGLVKDMRIEEGRISVQMSLTTSEPAIAEKIRADSRAALAAVPGVQEVDVKIDIQAPSQASGTTGPSRLEGVNHVIAVASGKGGVGKSTVAANLSVALSQLGLKVGLCDCDLYGPSMGIMFGVNERPMADDDNRILPIVREGIKLMSMGFLLDDGSPAVLRGPMVTRYTQQFLRQVAWAPLDFLVLDLPPGTGDIQLTIVQTIALSGAVIVTTPQEVALIDARKAVSMFQKTNVPVLGLVENMSHFLCPDNGKRYAIFGSGGGKREAARMKVPLLAEIPIDPAVCESGEIGLPVTGRHGPPEITSSFRSLAQSVTTILKQPGGLE